MAGMPRFRVVAAALGAIVLSFGMSAVRAEPAHGGTDAWIDGLSPIAPADWNYERARHLLERAGFGGTPDDIERLARMTPEAAVRRLVEYHSVENHLKPFEPSGVYDPSLQVFPESRPAATRIAEQTGQAMGVAVKPSGDRRLQPVVDRFFYWLRASALETRRIANWWADCMVATNHPLEEKMALFWHGHFATNEDKVRDYRKMLVQLELFHRYATGNFRKLLIGVAEDPAMLVFLDAAHNVKGAPNENFAREVMELFTMGVGHYTEKDIREGARAFTGWIDDDLSFKVDHAKHDDREKTFLGHTGNFDGVDVLNIILEQKATANFIAGKIYRFFVRDDLSPSLQEHLGAVLRDNDYEIAPLLRTIFLAKDFYSPPSMGTRIKGPVELIVSTYRQLGLKELPGIPDFNAASGELGQVLLDPPTVAGWAQGRAWITPGSLLERGNFALQVVFPDTIDFVDPNFDPGQEIRAVNHRILQGLDITAATMGKTADGGAMGGDKAMANVLANREEFNTRFGSLKGWQEATRKIKPILRAPAQFSLTEIVLSRHAETTADAVDLLLKRFLSVPADGKSRATLIAFLDQQLGTSDLVRAQTYLEEPLRSVVHLILSMPEYQLG
jgi:uncharacterized protein (DUF1800 family)